MKPRQPIYCLTLVILLVFATANAFQQDKNEKEFPKLRGPYLGQKSPGTTPTLFAPGIISTKDKEWSSAFTPDGKEYFIGYLGTPNPTILHMKEEKGIWSQPAIASFSGKYSDYDLTMSPDGNSLYFTSMRPLDGKGPQTSNPDLWVSHRKGEGWSEAINLGPGVNTEHRELYPSVTRDDRLYFFSNRPGGYGESDVYCSRLVDGKYSRPVNLGESVNTEYSEFDPVISPDGSFLIFSSERPDGYGKGDLHISFRSAEEEWSKAVNMGKKINSSVIDFCPGITPDGQYIFFVSGRPNPEGYPNIKLKFKDTLGASEGQNIIDIYWMEASVIDQFRGK